MNRDVRVPEAVEWRRAVRGGLLREHDHFVRIGLQEHSPVVPEWFRARVRREVCANRVVLPVLKGCLGAITQAVVAVGAGVCHDGPTERRRGDVFHRVSWNILAKADLAAGELATLDHADAGGDAGTLSSGWLVTSRRDQLATGVLKVDLMDLGQSGSLATLGLPTDYLPNLAAVRRLGGWSVTPTLSLVTPTPKGRRADHHTPSPAAQWDLLRYFCGLWPRSGHAKGPLTLQRCRSEALSLLRRLSDVVVLTD